MRVLICDLDRAAAASLDEGRAADAIIAREDLAAARDCTGCFGCWIETPGRCVLDDSLSRLGPLLESADEVDVVAANTFGGVSPLVKRALDRALPSLHPGSRVVEGLTCQRMRRPHDLAVRIRLYGPATAGGRACAAQLAAAYARGLGAQLEHVRLSADPMEPAGRAAPEDPAARPAGRPVELRAPARVGLLNASSRGEASATRALLDDFEDALRAYARASGSEAPALAQLSCSSPHGTFAQVDALVIGYPLHAGAQPAPLVGTLERLARTRALAPGTRVYAVVNLGAFEPEQAIASLDALRTFCAASATAWCGAIVIGGGRLICPTKNSPRMGTARRARSQATDRLIAAVRLGTNIDQALELAGGEADPALPDIVLARCPLPRPLYRAAAALGWRMAAHRNRTGPDGR